MDATTWSHWTTEDWVRHYAEPSIGRAVERHAHTGMPFYGMPYGVGAMQAAPAVAPPPHPAPHPAPARPAPMAPMARTVDSCPLSLKPVLVAGVLGVVAYAVFGPKVKAAAKKHEWGKGAGKSAAGIASLAAGGLHRASAKISEGAQSIGRRAEKFAKQKG